MLALAKTIVRKSWGKALGGFHHPSAQLYELISARGTMRRHFATVYATYKKDRENEDSWLSGNDQVFVDHIRDRTCLEIGSGPFGFLALAPRFWIKRRIVIDPLIDSYRRYQLAKFGKTLWTDEIETFAERCERIIPELRGAIDGAIICQNALDHMDDPIAALFSMSEYAAPGCYLRLWTDLWHLNGTDVGHRNITRNPAAMDRIITGFGFSIVQELPSVRSDPYMIEYGRIAIKQ